MNVERFISYLWKPFSFIWIFSNLELIKYLKYIFNLLFKLKAFSLKKRQLFFYIKIFFSFVTLYHCIAMTIDYMALEYRYNLIVEDNSEGFEWKPINLCTESQVSFDKHKVIQYFNLSKIYFIYENLFYNDKYYKGQFNLSWVAKFLPLKMELEAYIIVQFVEIILDDINIVEMNSLIVEKNDLFECSAKFHYKNSSIDSIAMEIKNCFEYFNIKTTLIENNKFGICYEFFETNSTIVLKEDDFIEIIIKFDKQRDFINNYLYQKIQLNFNFYDKFNQYFGWYYFINDDKSIASKSSLISSTRIGLSAELKISKTSIKMLSIPYMTYCEHFGCRHDFYKLSLDNDIFNYNNDSILIIKNNKKKNLIYNAEPRLEFVDFLSNIGGLFGLYFGLSFIDISVMMKSITRKIKIQLQRLIFNNKIEVLIEYLKLSQAKILRNIRRITKIPWKFILTFLSSPFFVSKMFNLIINYFQYSTQISFEFIEYQQKNQKISINEFPAITVCTEHMFEKFFFDKYYIYFNEQTLSYIYSENSNSFYWLEQWFKNYSLIGNRPDEINGEP